MRILISRFRSGHEVLERYQTSFMYGGLFLPTRQVIEPGELVVVDVRLPALKDHLLIRSLVAWHRRARRSESVRAGLGVEFLASEQDKRDYLLALSEQGEPAPPQRRHRRLPIELRCDWRIPNERQRHLSVVGDIGAGGAFIHTRALAPNGTPVVLELVPPGSKAPQTIEGRVAWSRRTPGAEGLGVEFRCRDIGGMRRLRELVKRIERASVPAASA